MKKNLKPIWTIGLMSGTSLDGMDAALIKTNGIELLEFGEFISWAFTPAMQRKLSLLIRGRAPLHEIAKIENEFTKLNAQIVRDLIKKSKIQKNEIKLIGFHGQTIAHDPAKGYTWQIGNGPMLAHLTGIDVIYDFRRADVAAAGEGAPLVPLYHAALFKNEPLPLGVVNIGGIANVTWIGKSENSVKKDIMAHDIVAFDTGPGNGLLNDLIKNRTGKLFDEDGKIAASGKPDEKTLNNYLSDKYFAKLPPKSLDKNSFNISRTKHLSTEDAAATLTELTVQTIARSVQHLPKAPNEWMICGGGAENKFLMKRLKSLLKNVKHISEFKLNAQEIEAQAFAFLAARSFYDLPISVPLATGVRVPTRGGVLAKA